MGLLKLTTKVLVLAALVLGSVAWGAEAGDDAATKELREILDIQPRPTSREEAMAKLKERLPKLEAFVEKHQTGKAGSQALMVLAQLQGQLGETDKALAALKTFEKRFPKDPMAAELPLFRAFLLQQGRQYDEAKAELKAFIKDNPDSPRLPVAQSMLDKMAIIGTEAKGFTTKSLDGKEVKLSDFRGKVVLLDFFAGWCGPCVAEMPHLKALYAKYKDKGFEILGVNMDRTLEDAKKYVAKDGLTWTVTWEAPGFWANPVAKLYGIGSIPAMYLLDKEGKVLAVGLRGDALTEALKQQLGEEEEGEAEKKEEKDE